MKQLITWFALAVLGIYLIHQSRTSSAPPQVVLVADTETERPVSVGEGDNRRETVEGLPVPIVPGTRVTEARIETPGPSRPAPSRRTAPGPNPPPGTQLITGQLSATEDRARADARRQLEREVADWLAPDVPRSWKTPEPFVDRLIETTQVKTVEKEYGTLYEATIQARLSPEFRAEIVENYQRELVGRRLATLAGIIAFVLSCLAALTGYIRADEATRGYYTNWLRAAAAAGVGAVGFAVYRLLA